MDPRILGMLGTCPIAKISPRSRFEVSPLDCKNYQTSVLPKKTLETWLYSLNLSAVTKIASWPWWWNIAWYQEKLCLSIWPVGKTVGKSYRRVVNSCCRVRATEVFFGFKSLSPYHNLYCNCTKKEKRMAWNSYFESRSKMRWVCWRTAIIPPLYGGGTG